MLRHAFVISLILVAAAAAGADGPITTVPDQNVAIVEAMIKAVNQRDFDQLKFLVAEDVERHSGATPGVVVTNLEEFMAYIEADLAICPDASQEINLIFGGGDKVAVHATYRGTQVGPMGPFPATGKRLELPFMAILRIADGKIAEMWVEWDNLNALGQLGLFPPE